MTKVITRRLNFKKYWCTSNSMETGFVSPLSPKWSNTFYIHFCKDDFPKLDFPIFQDGRFSYICDNDIASLPFHKGITFYEETKHIDGDRCNAEYNPCVSREMIQKLEAFVKEG